ncbi:MAG: ABC transporter permease [Bacteroidota bacterium]
MDKLWLIIKREYLTRVKKRSFILATLLTPLAIAVFILVVGLIFSYEGSGTTRIAVSDQSGVLDERNIKADAKTTFNKSSEDIEQLKQKVEDGDFDGLLVIPEIKDIRTSRHTVYYYYDETPPDLNLESTIRSALRKNFREFKIRELNFDKEALKALNTDIELEPDPINGSTEDASSMTSAIGAFLGGAMSFVMYMAVLIYGMMVMRSVMEEKMNRIVEVMISSVKPFQLMLGKIIGVGAVGLTQLGIWIILIPMVYLLSMLFIDIDPSQMPVAGGMSPEMIEAQIDVEDIEYKAALGMAELAGQNWALIIPLFIFFFLGGYFLYASLFAAVGSAMSDDLGEGQALTLPITIPIILAFYIMIVAVQSPQSNLAVWSSIFPLFSPIVMPARLAFSPPLWQIILSVVVMAASSLFFVWLSGRIYRVGILMYGKKVTLKTLWKWLFYKA